MRKIPLQLQVKGVDKMPLIQGTVTVAANTTIADVLVNNVLAIVQQNMRVDMALVAAATGLICDVNVGVRQIAPGMIPSEANRVPVIPDDLSLRFGMRVSDRVLLKVVNTTGGGIRLNFTLIFTPL
jgi:hypothetical protein